MTKAELRMKRDEQMANVIDAIKAGIDTDKAYDSFRVDVSLDRADLEDVRSAIDDSHGYEIAISMNADKFITWQIAA